MALGVGGGVKGGVGVLGNPQIWVVALGSLLAGMLGRTGCAGQVGGAHAIAPELPVLLQDSEGRAFLGDGAGDRVGVPDHAGVARTRQQRKA